MKSNGIKKAITLQEAIEATKANDNAFFDNRERRDYFFNLISDNLLDENITVKHDINFLHGGNILAVVVYGDNTIKFLTTDYELLNADDFMSKYVLDEDKWWFEIIVESYKNEDRDLTTEELLKEASELIQAVGVDVAKADILPYEDDDFDLVDAFSAICWPSVYNIVLDQLKEKYNLDILIGEEHFEQPDQEGCGVSVIAEYKDDLIACEYNLSNWGGSDDMVWPEQEIFVYNEEDYL